MYNRHTNSYIYSPNNTMTKAIQIRIDPKLKKDTDRILAYMGLDMASATRMFFRQIVLTRSIPFKVESHLTENGFTPEFEQQILEAEKSESIGPFANAKEAIRALHKLSKS